MSLEWMLIRGSGLVAFVLLAAATVWGLVVSLGVLPRSVKNLTLVHESLSVGALLAVMVHMAGLLIDDFVEFDLEALLVPGRSGWRPLAVSWGIVSFYGMVLVIASFYVRKSIGQGQWRAIHYGSFGVFLGALVHGLSAGTDSGHPAVFALYAAAATVVAVLVVVRVAMARAGGQGARASAPAGPGAAQAEPAEGGSRENRPKRDRAAMLAAAREAAGSPRGDG